MRAPAFYWGKPGILSALFAPLAAVYGAIAAARMRRKGTRAPVPVVCVGNPTLGGAGKTPTALALAELLQALGERPAIISRGYGGRQRGPLLVDPERYDGAEVGDEAVLLARAFPTVVARDRVKGAALAASHDASVVVLDDGFQNPGLAKDLSFLVIDTASGIGNGKVFPAGPLRAPLRAQLERAHALIRVGDGDAADFISQQAAAMQLPVLDARLVPDVAATKDFAGRQVLAFAGIGHPQKFLATLAATGVRIVESRSFADHHYYSTADMHSLLNAAEAGKLDLVTTEKDRARIAGDPALAALATAVRTLPVKLEFSDAPAVRALLVQALAEARKP